MNTALQSKPMPPVIKTITVPWTQAEAFKRFTEGMTLWWPTRSHSVAESGDLDVVFEPRVGGLVYEQKGEHRATWAEVLIWEPDARFVLNWHPGRAAESGGALEVRFIDNGDSCRIELTHSGWEKLGEKAREIRAGYETGWDHVLALYSN
ncbi:MAG: ATPase [Xanthomonadales bacterium]|nr:SRPBCC domain-containing protein [Gammaproteobacteria bacterium]NNE04334.1 ATPase [Xanthomonadales bacterium]NNL95359.1 ATPase [Xanthomonadales bacterium]